MATLEISTRPYLVRAMHEWCSDNGYTPYLVIAVCDEYTQVPMEYVKNQEIVLNISYDATQDFSIHNDYILFSAQFRGVSKELIIPIGAVLSIFARETGGGMSFEYEAPHAESKVHGVLHRALGSTLSVVSDEEKHQDNDPDDTPPAPSNRPTLTVVK